MSDSPPDDLSGKVIAGRYRVERLIGKGGMGTVWAGRHLTLGQLVAIKFIHEKLAGSGEALRRFDLEAKAAARLKTNHAVTVFDHGVTESGRPYIVMEYLEGETLHQAIARRGPLPLEEVKYIFGQAALALDAAHSAHIVHRDLKPDNIFLARNPELGGYGYSVKLVDFGIAKIVHDEAAEGAQATQAGQVLGTPHYMSPEALTASAPVSPASDVWSFGASAFAAMTGRVPFEGDAIGDVVLKVCAAPLPVPSKVNPAVPRAFDEWFARSCKRQPAARFASVREQGRALEQLEAWSEHEKDASAYALVRRDESELDRELSAIQGGRGRGLALGLIFAAVLVGAAGYYAVHVARQANLAVEQTAASASRVVDEENERKLREAEAHFWSAAADGGVDAGARVKAPKKR
ncbi:MAG: serine/threonine protein kinase [Polyangiaceae bacterium]|nr:serine/threonine protein kinase [Polyangiaceae bacterium]